MACHHRLGSSLAAPRTLERAQPTHAAPRSGEQPRSCAAPPGFLKSVYLELLQPSSCRQSRPGPPPPHRPARPRAPTRACKLLSGKELRSCAAAPHLPARRHPRYRGTSLMRNRTPSLHLRASLLLVWRPTSLLWAVPNCSAAVSFGRPEGTTIIAVRPTDVRRENFRAAPLYQGAQRATINP